jgi:hypothetical protein
MARSRTWTSVGAVIAAIALLAGFGTPASAAPPYRTDATVDSLQFTTDTVASGSFAEIHGTWSLPDRAARPAGFALALPAELRGRADRFAVVDPAGETMGSCTVTADRLSCDLDDAYLAAHPVGVHGEFRFWVAVDVAVTQNTIVEFAVGETRISVAVTPPDRECQTACAWDGRETTKWGSYTYEDDTILWHVDIGAGPRGMAGGVEVKVTDSGGPLLDLIPADTRVAGTNEYEGPNGEPSGWHDLPADEYTVSADGATASFTSREGWTYGVLYRTRVRDHGAANVYRNSATVESSNSDTLPVQGEVTRQGGSATGVGNRVGAFGVTKTVTGSAPPIEGLAFLVRYTATPPGGGRPVSAEFELAAGATWTSPDFVVGTRIHLDEVLPTGPAHLAWAEPRWSVNDFEIAGGTRTSVDLVNEATALSGRFAARKRIEGDASLVPPDTTFDLAYSYPAGPGFAAGGGTLTLPADGSPVDSGPIPVGAVVSLVETTPARIHGADWGVPRLSATRLVIGTDDVVTVTVVNTLTTRPPQPPTLAATGTSSLAPGAIAGLLVLLAGGALCAARRGPVRR